MRPRVSSCGNRPRSGGAAAAARAARRSITSSPTSSRATTRCTRCSQQRVREGEWPPDAPDADRAGVRRRLRRVAGDHPQGAQHAAGGEAGRCASRGAARSRCRRRAARTAPISAGSSRTSSTSSCTPRCACCRSPRSRCPTKRRGCSTAPPGTQRSRSCACAATARRRSRTRRRYVPEPEAELLTRGLARQPDREHGARKAGVATVSAEQRLSATVAGVEVAKHLQDRSGRAADQHDARDARRGRPARSR